MRKVISILLLSIYLLATTELHQLVKIPLMLQHFQQFEKMNPGFGIGAFLHVHYAYPLNEKDSDYEQDRQLPFKSVDSGCFTIISNVIVPQPFYFIVPKVFAPIKSYPVHKDDFHTYTLAISIFQPPRA